MLKLQLGSKIATHLPDWNSAEDLLTSDFFGALDYLPRKTYLRDFLGEIAALNCGTKLPLADVAWDTVTFHFWPRRDAEDEGTEPDLVIISNRWVIVVEVKLNSGFGTRQPIREYLVGRDWAQEQGISTEEVYYLLVSKFHLDVRTTFTDESANLRDSLLAHTMVLRWSDACACVDGWLRRGIGGNPNTPECIRLLEDVLGAIRLRHALAFSGFRFPQHEAVDAVCNGFFPSFSFTGFLKGGSQVQAVQPPVFISPGMRFGGFLTSTPLIADIGPFIGMQLFNGFLVDAVECPVVAEGFGLRSKKEVSKC